MKYLHLVQWSPRKSFGGYETIVRDVASAQQVRKDTVYVVGRIEGKRYGVRSVNVGGVTYVEVSFPMARRPSSLNVGLIGLLMLFVEIFVSLLILSPVVVQILRREKIDAVIFYGIHLMLMGPIVRLAGSTAILGLEVLQKNQITSHSSFLYWFRRVKYACFNGIFTYTYFFYLDGKKYNNISLLKSYAPRIPVVYIPWGIDVDGTQAIQADKDLLTWKKKASAYIILCPRRLVEEKGVRYLMEAIPFIIEKIPSAQVIFAGDGLLRGDLVKRAQELGVSNYVRFTGFMDHRKTLAFMKASDMIVVPSSGEESFGMVFLEAYALGIPIVSTIFGGIPNVVNSGQTGILVVPKRSDKLGEAIVSMLRNAKQREKYIRAGLKTVHSDFKIEMTLGKIDELVRRINNKII